MKNNVLLYFLSPIALYGVRDLHTVGDDGWCHTYHTILNQPSIGFQQVGKYGNGTDLCILSYGNGYYLSRQAAKTLKDIYGIDSTIIDIRWLHPLPESAILEAVSTCQNTLIVDECRKTGSLSETLMALLLEHGQTASRLCADDCFIPLGKAAKQRFQAKIR